MAMIVKKKPAPPPIEAGTYTGILVGIVDIGEQLETYGKEDEAPQHVDEFLFIFEIAGETIDRGNGPEPRWQRKKITKSIGAKSNMKKIADALNCEVDFVMKSS